MKYTEETLKSWTAPLSVTEEQRSENTIDMVRSAIDHNDKLKKMNIETFVQGSFANNTNVRAESDVDVCVMLKDVFHTKLPKDAKDADYGFTDASLTFPQYRDLVKKALQDKFKTENIKDGNKSIKIDENTYHVKADVVPAFLLRNYYYSNSKNPNDYVEGTWILPKTGADIANYPKIHIKNGKKKNNETNGEYKKLVRIMKHIKNNMVEDNVTDGNIISSFLVECLVWNIPNQKITSYSTWTDTVREAIRYLYTEIDEGRHKEWGEVSEILYLFINRKWTDLDAKQWLVDAWNYLGCANQ